MLEEIYLFRLFFLFVEVIFKQYNLSYCNFRTIERTLTKATPTNLEKETVNCAGRTCLDVHILTRDTYKGCLKL